MDKKNFYIKHGYKNQTVNKTLSVKEGDLYWTDERVRISGYYQYEAYVIAKNLMKKHGLKSVADVGCGAATKLFKVLYPTYKDVLCVDQKEAIDYCKQTYDDGTFLVENLEKPNKPKRTYDMVISADVIEHMENPNKLVEYLKQLCADDGFIVISTPERDILRGEDCMGSPKPEHIREWNKEELLTYLKSRDLEILEHTMIPIAKRTLHPEVRKIRAVIKKRSGTVDVNQVVVCKPKKK